MEQVTVSGVASDRNQVKWTLQNVQNQPGVAATLFGRLSEESIIVDIIVQDVSKDGRLTISFTVGENDSAGTRKVIDGLKEGAFSEMNASEEKGLAKVSIVGVGMQHHPGSLRPNENCLTGQLWTVIHDNASW